MNDFNTIMWIADLLLGSGILGVWWRSAKAKGMHEQAAKELRGIVVEQGKTILAHTAQLAANEGSFKVIDTKLDYIKEGLDELKGK